MRILLFTSARPYHVQWIHKGAASIRRSLPQRSKIGPFLSHANWGLNQAKLSTSPLSWYQNWLSILIPNFGKLCPRVHDCSWSNDNPLYPAGAAVHYRFSKGCLMASFWYAATRFFFQDRLGDAKANVGLPHCSAGISVNRNPGLAHSPETCAELPNLNRLPLCL